MSTFPQLRKLRLVIRRAVILTRIDNLLKFSGIVSRSGTENTSHIVRILRLRGARCDKLNTPVSNRQCVEILLSDPWPFRGPFCYLRLSSMARWWWDMMCHSDPTENRGGAELFERVDGEIKRVQIVQLASWLFCTPKWPGALIYPAKKGCVCMWSCWEMISQIHTLMVLLTSEHRSKSRSSASCFCCMTFIWPCDLALCYFARVSVWQMVTRSREEVLTRQAGVEHTLFFDNIWPVLSFRTRPATPVARLQ